MIKEILNHIAIPVSFPDDIRHFYSGVFGFGEEYSFNIDENTAMAVFGVSHPINVVVVEKHGLRIELYLTGESLNRGISHICLNTSDIDDMCLKAEKAGYPVVRISRPASALAFITDKSGNRFEIKQESQIREG